MTFLSGFECGILFTLLVVASCCVRFHNLVARFFERFESGPRRRLHRAVRRDRGSRYSLNAVQRDVVQALMGQGMMSRRQAEGAVRPWGGYPESETFDALFKAVTGHAVRKQVLQ